MQLIYNDQGTLHVMVKTVKVPPINSLENMSGILLVFSVYVARVHQNTVLSETSARTVQ